MMRGDTLRLRVPVIWSSMSDSWIALFERITMPFQHTSTDTLFSNPRYSRWLIAVAHSSTLAVNPFMKSFNSLKLSTGQTLCLFSWTTAIKDIRPFGGLSLSSGNSNSCPLFRHNCYFFTFPSWAKSALRTPALFFSTLWVFDELPIFTGRSKPSCANQTQYWSRAHWWLWQRENALHQIR